MKRRAAAWFRRLVVFLGLGGATILAAELRVVGSDLLGVDFSKALYASAGRSDVKVALAFDGSRPGLEAVRAGRAQLAVCVFAPGEESGAAAFERWPVAYHRVVVLAPAAAPIEQITVEQLAGVFGVGGPLSISEWRALGGEGVWGVANIAPQAPAVSGGITAEFFRQVVLQGRPFRPNVGRYDRLDDLVHQFGRDSRALAIAPEPLSSSTKVLAVASRAGRPAHRPTAENLHSGDYPLRLPVHLVFRRESAAAVLPLMKFFFSDETVPLFERVQLVPLPAAARRQQVLALEKL